MRRKVWDLANIIQYINPGFKCHNFESSISLKIGCNLIYEHLIKQKSDAYTESQCY
jgi:hypothetical protein